MMQNKPSMQSINTGTPPQKDNQWYDNVGGPVFKTPVLNHSIQHITWSPVNKILISCPSYNNFREQKF